MLFKTKFITKERQMRFRIRQNALSFHRITNVFQMIFDVLSTSFVMKVVLMILILITKFSLTSSKFISNRNIKVYAFLYSRI